ncbi:methyl-accepting chemotaxis protein [Cohnella suwonensis]|uniref:Methyl-accepting chemotaxis protein n=1 Tax=Cohnella suwonensis TaxID=696072 RepID=A0ABW0LRP1_9BACL
MRSIGTKLFLVFFVVIGLTSASLGLFSYSASKTAIVDQARASSAQTIALAGEKLDMKLQFYLDSMNQLVKNSEFQEQLFQFANAGSMPADELDGRISAILGMLDRLALSDPLIRNISLLSLSDPIPLISTEREAGRPDKDADWIKLIRETEGKPVWLPISSQGYLGGAPSAKPVFACAKLLGKSNVGSNEYALLIQIESTALQAMIDGIKLGEHAETVVADGEDRLIAASGLDEAGWKSILPSVSGVAAAGEEIRKDDSGEERLVAYRISPVTGWMLAGSAPLHDLTGATENIRKVTYMAVAASIAVAILVGLWIYRFVAKPLGSLKRLMRQAADGDLRVRMNYRSKDEIGHVSAAFNQMTAHIGQLVADARLSAEDALASSGLVSEAARRTADSSREIYLAADQIAQGAASLAAASERSGGSVSRIGEEMSDSFVLQCEMSDAARLVHDHCEEGGLAARMLLRKTEETDLHFRRLGDKVNGLADGAEAIREMLGLITRLAKQTTILSLNASIEAARGGQSGGGFKVIADEIRRLAEQSNASIKQAETLAEGIREEVGSAVHAMRSAEPFFREMSVDVGSVHRLFHHVNGLMAQLKERLDTGKSSMERLQASQEIIAHSIGEVSAVSQQSSASTDQVAALCLSQRQIGDELVALSSDLKAVSAKLEQQMASFLV